MITWTTSQELASHLSGYPPIGLRLRPFFHAKYDVDPKLSIPRDPEISVLEGLGNASTWSGFVDTLPFAITSMAHRSQYGLQVSFPTPSAGDRALLEALSELAPPRALSLYFETRPIVSGFAVVSEPEGPIYSAKSREDAAAAAKFAERVAHTRFTIVPVKPSTPVWIVVGPLTGPYVSELEVFASARAAHDYAAERSHATGVSFGVQAEL